jgi:uncharacterized protein
MLVVDTNILVYAADADSTFHNACRKWLETQRRRPDAWFSTWPIIYEFLRVSTHPRVMRRPWTAQGAWQFIVGLLASPGFGVLVPSARHHEVASDVIAELPQVSGNMFHDAHTAILMREHGVKRIVTRDTDFHRFPFLESFDPVMDSGK